MLIRWVIFITFLFAIFIACVFYKVRVFYVVSGSMEPSIQKNSFVFVWNTPSYVSTQNRLGQVVAFYDLKTNKTILHRVVDLNQGKLITKGDANSNKDLDLLEPRQIIGEALFSVPIRSVFFLTFQILLSVFLLLAGVLVGRFLVFLKYELSNKFSVFGSLR